MKCEFFLQIINEPIADEFGMVFYDTITNDYMPNGRNMNRWMLDNWWATRDPKDEREDGTLPWEVPKIKRDVKAPIAEENEDEVETKEEAEVRYLNMCMEVKTHI